MSLSRKRQIKNLVNEQDENPSTTSQTNSPKVEFAPTFFEGFEGTQEELDALMNEIRAHFESLTFEELEAMSRPIDVEELIADVGEEQAERLLKTMELDLDESAQEYRKKLH